MTNRINAEHILQNLGVSEPKNIDLEAIAYTLNARVRYKPLDGCEARIVGNSREAIVTVNSRSSSNRKRFSLAHELGHWCCHRGKVLLCKREDIGRTQWSIQSPERAADAFAADLLMPWYLFRPIAQKSKSLTFQVTRGLASLFDVSTEAAAIRLMHSGIFPALIVSHDRNGRKWFQRSPLVPDHWFPRAELDSRSSAFDVVYGKANGDSIPRKVSADVWFDRRDAQGYEVIEQSIPLHRGRSLTIVSLSDSKMLKA